MDEATTEAATTEYEVITQTDEYRVTVPSDWKVTFGAMHPGSRGGYGQGPVLRFYENEKKQRMIFRDVVSFRDLSIPLMRKITQKHAAKHVASDSFGNIVADETVEVDSVWEEME